MSLLLWGSLIGCLSLNDIGNGISKLSYQNARRSTGFSSYSGDKFLKCLTFNIRLGAGRENPFTKVQDLSSSRIVLKRIAAAIDSVNPDIIALQEVKGVAQASFLAGELNLNYAYASHGRENFDWGLAVLSKFKILSAKSAIIQKNWDPRVGLICRIETMSGPITCINVHYYLAQYKRQVNETIKVIKDAGSPVILMGDMNFSNLDGDLSPILRQLVDTCDAVDTEGSRSVKRWGTVPSVFRYRLDFILVDKDYFDVKDVGLLSEDYQDASDHIGYFAIIESE